MHPLQAQMNLRRYDAGRQDGVSEVKECIGAAIKATIEGETETTQDIEFIRGFHSEAFCYRRSPEATRCCCFLPVQLKHKLRLYPKTAKFSSRCAQAN